jgi:hypothetical protein
MTAFPWPKLDGAPDREGGYWFNPAGGAPRCCQVYEADYWHDESREGRRGLCIDGSSWGDAEPVPVQEQPGTWYGPIPPPPTGERKPCGAWERTGPWLVLRDEKGHSWATVIADEDQTESEQIAAEDRMWAELRRRAAMLAGIETTGEQQ